MLLQYTCPSCGDDMAFDTNTGTLSCDSCGREDNIEAFQDDYIIKKFSNEEAKEYHCNNCGAIVMTDSDTTATSCSFCNSNVVIADRLTGNLAPKMVIPFSISKEEARKTFRKWCKNGRFTPKGFMSANRIKNMTGIYVPFWIYDLDNKVKLDAIGTKVRTYTRGDYIYTETKFYDIHRDIDISYSKVPADASIKMNDGLMDTLEPFHYKDLKEFKTPYLAGYLAEKYNFDDEALYERVKAKIRPYLKTYVNGTVRGYSTVRDKNESVQTKSSKSTYVLFPIWMVYYDYNQQEHTFAMNGQTGKVVGKPPTSKRKIITWVASIASGSFIVMKIMSYVMGGILW